jgi:hypothetical protein
VVLLLTSNAFGGELLVVITTRSNGNEQNESCGRHGNTDVKIKFERMNASSWRLDAVDGRLIVNNMAFSAAATRMAVVVDLVIGNHE